MYVLGIDPGVNGAMALLNISLLQDFLVIDYGGRDQIKKFLREHAKHIALAGIEEVSAMPRFAIKNGAKERINPGTKSMLTCGKGAGYYEGAIDMLDIPYMLFKPAQWQKGLLRKKKEGEHKKQRSMDAARQLFPKAELYGKLRGMKDGRADALLIAYHTRREFLGKEK